jgi:cardiolipin synthase
MSGPGTDDRILTIPNLLTAVRLLAIPVFVVLVVGNHRGDWFGAAVLLAALGATDWVDGFLARRLRQVSTLGKVLDPLADRLLLVSAAISIIAVGAVPLVIAIIALLREATVALGFLIVAVAGGRRMDVTLAGKATTLCLMVALPLFLVGHSTVGWHRGAETAAWVFVLPGLVIGWYSVVAYVGPARRAVAAGRRGRGGPDGMPAEDPAGLAPGGRPGGEGPR